VELEDGHLRTCRQGDPDRREAQRHLRPADSCSRPAIPAAISEVIVQNHTDSPGPPQSVGDSRESRDAIPGQVARADLAIGSEHRRELAEEIFVCMLQELRPRQRAALLLAEFCNFTLPEIADILQIPEGVACSMVREARKVLRRE
jgi:DNA-directed RNA polymerase specialized sigma24 family protein